MNSKDCPDCGHFDGEDGFDERPWQCAKCGSFFPELSFRENSNNE